MAAVEYDVIVLGVGGIGSAALYHLAKRGLKVLGIEQFGIAHDRGSSHGLTRIIRLAYYEHPSYVPFLRRAYTLWDELEQASGQKLLYTTGSVDAGPPDSLAFAGSLQSCLEHGLPHEVLTSRELTARFPGYRLPPETMAVFQPQGGLLVPEACITAHVQQAQRHGADLHIGERVLGWDVTADGGVQVETDQGRTYRARHLAICGGAWMGKLVPYLATRAIPERQVVIWLETKQPELFTPERFPVWNAQVDEGRYYGFPEFNPAGTTPGMKFGRYHHLNEVTDPDAVDWDVHPADEAILRQFGEKYFPDGSGRTLSMVVCMFTNTANEHFIIDRLPGAPQVTIASACSGHAYKMCSVIGETVADLSQHGTTQNNIDLFRLAAHA